MRGRIRLATPRDARGIWEIYAPLVRDTWISFEVRVPTPADMRARVEQSLAVLPWLVAEDDDGTVVGYAYASPHRTREAYQWSVDVSAYVRAEARRAGFARRLYEDLFSILRRLGYRSAFAGIALPNDASVGLHSALGFQPIGIYRSVGYKLGRWRDVGWWQLELDRLPDPPPAPRTMADLLRTEGLGPFH